MRMSIDKAIKFQELETLIRKGGRFISYQYIISMPVFFPTKRMSRLFFIRNNEKASKYSLKYNILNFLLGFWGLPFGPPNYV